MSKKREREKDMRTHVIVNDLSYKYQIRDAKRARRN